MYVCMDSMYLVAYSIRYGDIYRRTCVPPCPLPSHSTRDMPSGLIEPANTPGTTSLPRTPFPPNTPGTSSLPAPPPE